LAAAEKIKIDYPNAQCQIVGKIDTDNPSCIGKTEIDDAQLKNIVQYFGPSDQVLEYIRNADCVVLPSYREGLPRVMLEAISMAKPIITTDAPGCRDTVVDGENGFMVPIRDSEALYNAMKKIISCDTETLKKMGLKGRELALNEFDEAIVFEKYIDLVKILIQ
jgi:glycosyltransferase involved in cell wall biosynthesis